MTSKTPFVTIIYNVNVLLSINPPSEVTPSHTSDDGQLPLLDVFTFKKASTLNVIWRKNIGNYSLTSETPNKAIS